MEVHLGRFCPACSSNFRPSTSLGCRSTTSSLAFQSRPQSALQASGDFVSAPEIRVPREWNAGSACGGAVVFTAPCPWAMVLTASATPFTPGGGGGGGSAAAGAVEQRSQSQPAPRERSRNQGKSRRKQEKGEQNVSSPAQASSVRAPHTTPPPVSLRIKRLPYLSARKT